MATVFDEEGNPVSEDQQPDPTAADQTPPDAPPPGSQDAPPPIQATGTTTYGQGYDPVTGIYTDPATGQTSTYSSDVPPPSGGLGGVGTGGEPGGGGGGGGGGNAAAAAGGGGGGMSAADVARQIKDALGKLGGGSGGWSEADFQAYMGYLQRQADVETQRYNQSFGLETSKFEAQKEQFQKDLDLRTAIQQATQAYQTALLQTRNVELAQNAARDAMTRDFQMQDLQFRRQQNAANVDIEREKLDLQRRLLPAARTTRRAATVQNI